MNKIYKYKISPDCYVRIPSSGKFLSAASQNGDICIWVVFASDETEKTEHHIIAVPTGVDFDAEGLVFLATVHHEGLVFHIFEKADRRC